MSLLFAKQRLQLFSDNGSVFNIHLKCFVGFKGNGWHFFLLKFMHYKYVLCTAVHKYYIISEEYVYYTVSVYAMLVMFCKWANFLFCICLWINEYIMMFLLQNIIDLKPKFRIYGNKWWTQVLVAYKQRGNVHFLLGKAWFF
jgi:hypothetical protein